MKPTIDRREFLSLSATAAGASLLPKALLAMTANTKNIPPAPVARVDVVKDTYFGDTVSDPYRWMENSKDPDWLPFLKGQNDHARAILDELPGRAALLKRIEALSGDSVTTTKVERAGGLTFFQQRPLGADNFKLFVRDEKGADRVLIDPTLVSGPKGHTSLDWWQPSPDGKYVVYGLSKNGSEDSLLHVLTVADGKDLPDRIADTQSAGPAWLDDGSGFFYCQLTGKIDTPERYLDSRTRFHKLGTDPDKDPIIMQRGLAAGIVFEKIQGPRIETFFGSKYAVLTLSDVRPEFRSYVAPLAQVLAGKPKWTELTKFEDEITDIDVEGDEAYLVANKGAPRGRVLKASLRAPNLQAAKEMVPQGSDVI
jgi:prolyl oligopeptidase